MLYTEHGYLRGKKYVNASAFAVTAANTASASLTSSKLVSIFSGIYVGSTTTSPAPTAPSSSNSLQSGSVSPMTSAAVAGAANKQQSKTLMDLVIETITKCSDEYDESVQIQVIKALLTAITSLHCEVYNITAITSYWTYHDSYIFRRYTRLLFYWLFVLAFTYT